MRMLVSALVFGVIVAPAGWMLGFNPTTWRWLVLLVVVLCANDLGNQIAKALIR